MAEPKKKKTNLSSSSEDYILSNSDLNYAGLTNLARELKSGARLVQSADRLVIEINGAKARRMRLRPYLYVQFGAIDGRICKYIPRGSDQKTPIDPAEKLLPQLKQIEESLIAFLSEKTNVRFEE